MRPTQTRSFRMMGRLAGALLAVAGLALGVSTHGATAAEPPSPPTLVAVEARGPEKLSISVADVVGSQATPWGIRVNLYQADAFVDGRDIHPGPGTPSSFAFEIGGPPPSSWDVVLQPNTRYCVGLKTWVGTGSPDSSTFSEESSRLCATTSPLPATAADLQVAELPWVEQAGGVAGCVAGNANNVRAVIKNAGDTEVGGVFTVQLIVDNQLAGTATVGGASANSDKTSYVSGVSLTKGLHTLQVQVDPENKVPEFDEDNNTSPPLTVACEEPAPGPVAAGGVEKPGGAAGGPPDGGVIAAGGEQKPGQDPTDDRGDDDNDNDDNDNDNDR